jgi:2-polyprenyl-6-hydroxyphenyl methylase/3-demethylubiquinone-9 3-methyltransferase
MGTNSARPVDNSIYETYGERWYTAHDDPIALLRAESKTILPWALEQISHHGGASSVLDVGCGAGFLTNALAKEKFVVSGLDLSPESLETAQRHDSTGTVRYRSGNAYCLPYSDGSFDVVTSMDFLEHVDNPDLVISEITRVLKPDGLFLFHTFNRNWLAHLVIIKLVEWLVKNTPKDMHVIHLFLKPEEVKKLCVKHGMRPGKFVGIRPSVSSIPFRSIFSGVVPESLRFKIVRSTKLSYLGSAVKNSTQSL